MDRVSAITEGAAPGQRQRYTAACVSLNRHTVFSSEQRSGSIISLSILVVM